jgi:hypothetical protein
VRCYRMRCMMCEDAFDMTLIRFNRMRVSVDMDEYLALTRFLKHILVRPVCLIRSYRDDVQADLDVAVHSLRVRAELMGQMRE